MQGQQTLRPFWLPCVQSTTLPGNAGMRAQLNTLWLRHVKALYPEEVQDEAAAMELALRAVGELFVPGPQPRPQPCLAHYY